MTVHRPLSRETAARAAAFASDSRRMSRTNHLHHTHHPRHNARATLAGSAALLLVLSACSNDGAATSADASGKSGEATAVNVLVHDSFSVPDELIAQFEEDSGYKVVTTSPGDAGVVVNQLILAKDNPTVDAVYGVENFSAAKAIDEGVFATYTSPNLPESAKQYVLDEALTPIDMGDVCVNVDHAWFKENNLAEPVTLDDLAKPEYAKLLVVEDAAASSPGLAFLVGTIGAKGEDGYQAYWKQLFEGGAKVASGWSDAYYTDFSGADGKGDYPLVVSYASSPAETEGATGSLDATCTRQVEYAGVVEGAKNAEGAQAFIDFLLSDPVQEAIPSNMYMYPVNTDIALPAEWEKYAKLTDKPIAIDAAKVSENRDAWIKSWTTLYEETAK
ncbi:MAG: thiamine ABC transporter substrate-binding protein [Ancrocorticia sp.]